MAFGDPRCIPCKMNWMQTGNDEAHLGFQLLAVVAFKQWNPVKVQALPTGDSSLSSKINTWRREEWRWRISAPVSVYVGTRFGKPLLGKDNSCWAWGLLGVCYKPARVLFVLADSETLLWCCPVTNESQITPLEQATKQPTFRLAELLVTYSSWSFAVFRVWYFS